jgi:hypothetical protein
MREPTVSVTSLVKQIACEETARQLISIREELKRLNDKVQSVIRTQNCQSMVKNMENTIFGGLNVRKAGEYDRSMAGARWTSEEECQLQEEVTAAIHDIAAKHKRYPSSIRSRMAKLRIATFDYHNPQEGD